MNNFFNIFKKMMPNKKEIDKKQKEEDISSDVVLNFDVTSLKVNEKLDKIVKDIKVGGEIIYK